MFGKIDADNSENNVTYSLSVKGNFDVTENSNNLSNEFCVSLKKNFKDENSILFELAYMVENQVPYFYVRQSDGKVEKIKGLSLLNLANAIEYNLQNIEDFDEKIEDTKIRAKFLLPVFASSLFGETAEKYGDDYIFNYNLSNICSNVIDIIDFANRHVELIPTDTIDRFIVEFWGGTQYLFNDEEKSVYNLETMLEYLNVNYGHINGKIVLTHNVKENKFKSGKISVISNQQTTKFEISKFELGNEKVNVFEDFELSDEIKNTATEKNILNFKINGEATGFNIEGEEHRKYEFSINSNLNPDIILPLLNQEFSYEHLKNLDWQNLGFLNFYIKETGEEINDSNTLNVAFTSDFKNKRFIVNAQLPDTSYIITLDITAGGVYEIQPLIDIISELKPIGDDKQDLDYVETFFKVIQYLEYKNIKENGLTIYLDKVADKLLDMAELEPQDYKSVLLKVFGDNHTLNIKVKDFIYFEAEDNNEIINTITQNSYFKDQHDFITEITEVPMNLVYDLYETIGFDESKRFSDGLFSKNPKSFPLKGINLDGAEVETSGKILMIKGVDTTKEGEYDATLYIGIDNDMGNTFKWAKSSGQSLSDMIPLFGVLEYKTKITVRFDREATMALSLTDMKTDIANQTKTIDEIMSGNVTATITYADETTRTLNLTKDNMNDLWTYTVENLDGSLLADDVISDGKFVKKGDYVVKVKINSGYESKINFKVVEYEVSSIEKAENGSEFIYDKSNMTVTEIDSENNQTVLEIVNIAYVTTDSNGENKITYRNLTDMTNDVDGKKILSLPATSVGKTFYIEVSFKADNGKTLVKESNKIEVTKNLNFISITQVDAFKNALPITTSLNGMLIFNQADVDYTLEYDNANTKWIAKDAEGTIMEKEIAISFVSKDALTFASILENGAIKFDNTNEISSKHSSKSPQYRIEATVTVGETSEKIIITYQVLDVVYEKIFMFSEQTNLDNAISFVADGEEFELKYADGKYSIFKKGTSELVSDVEVTAKTYSFWGSGSLVTLTDGNFEKTGKYDVTFKFNMYGLTFNHTQYVTYK